MEPPEHGSRGGPVLARAVASDDGDPAGPGDGAQDVRLLFDRSSSPRVFRTKLIGSVGPSGRRVGKCGHWTCVEMHPNFGFGACWCPSGSVPLTLTL